ncbi:hypothetical protein SY85_21305 [Flavisolibacter tropicus]|uniref:Uncharacterized protein n=1 Tax=Flavisolibacter tropicus TaxID=1492898 RepID=A0A172TZW4_9BACT|nr:hypothetical protein SY85_21305 [Flavisolibacter tropicus]
MELDEKERGILNKEQGRKKGGKAASWEKKSTVHRRQSTEGKTVVDGEWAVCVQLVAYSLQLF